jgi:hypothetical protein
VSPQEKFCHMLIAMVGEEELEEMQDKCAEDAPENWGLDTDEEAEARTDYADVWN